MILVVDLCGEENSLHKSEFVEPVVSVVQEAGKHVEVIHFTRLPILLKDREFSASAIILCGTALKDNLYQSHLRSFDGLKNLDCPILGICAGMHILCMLWGGQLFEKMQIGVVPLESLELQDNDQIPLKGDIPRGYHLHNHSVIVPGNFVILARSYGGPAIVKHETRAIYGTLFHPEVLNHEVIEHIINL